jgi:hypothetical protein
MFYSQNKLILNIVIIIRKNIYGMLYWTNNCESNIIIIYGMHTVFTWIVTHINIFTLSMGGFLVFW